MFVHEALHINAHSARALVQNGELRLVVKQPRHLQNGKHSERLNQKFSCRETLRNRVRRCTCVLTVTPHMRILSNIAIATLHMCTHNNTTHAYSQQHNTFVLTATLYMRTHSNTTHAYSQRHYTCILTPPPHMHTHSNTTHAYSQHMHTHSTCILTATLHMCTHSNTAHVYSQQHYTCVLTAKLHMRTYRNSLFLSPTQHIHPVLYGVPASFPLQDVRQLNLQFPKTR